MKLQKTTMRVICGTMALVLATVSAAAATADSLPPMSEYNVPSDSSLPQNVPDEQAAADEQKKPQEQEEEKNYLGKKSETVYVNLHPDGSVRETIVTDWLHSDTAGAALPDRTDLEDLTNVKGTETPQKEGDSLVWNLSGKDLYYRGKTNKPLPLEVSITYSLDGEELTPEEIAGKSGKMEMKLRFQNTTKHNVTIAGKQTEMQTPLMVIAGMSLSTDHFSNIDVSDGTVVADGNNQVVSIVSMPGLEKSLNIGKYSLKEINDMEFPEEFTVTADVKDFEMGPVGIAVTSELTNLEDIKKSEDIDDMRQDLYDLQDMQDDLDRADPDRDLRSLITNPERTEAAQLLVDDIFTFYDLNKDILDILPKYITDENIKLYDRIKYDLKDSTLDTMLDDDAVSEILDLVDEVSPAKMQSLADNFEKIDLKALRTLTDRCSELTSVFGVSDSQKHIATLKKLAACRDPMFALMGDMKSLDDAVFGKLMMASIVSQIPGTGTIPPEMQGLLKMLLPNMESEIGKDMADGYTSKNTLQGIASADFGIAEKQNAAPEMKEIEMPEKPDASDTDDQQTEVNPDPSQSGESQESDDSQEPEKVDPVPTKPSEDTDDADSGKTPDEKEDPDAKSDTPAPSGYAEENGEAHTAVLAAFVEKAEQPDAISEDSASEPQTDAEPQPEETVQVSDEAITDVAVESTEEKAIEAPVTYELGAGITPRMKILGALNTLFDADHLDATCEKLKHVPSFQSLVALRSHAGALKLAMAEQGLSPDDLPGAMAFADSMLTKVESLQSLVEACFYPLVKNVSDPAKKAEIIQKAMKQMTEDLAVNKENFTSLILLMNKLKEENLLDEIEYIDDLRKDMQDLRPIVKNLNRDLDKNYINISMHQSPETTTTLLKMRDDLEAHRDISESLRTAMLPKNIDIGRSMINTLDRLQAKDAVGDSISKMDDADELLDRKEALVDLSEQYRIFTDAPEELDTELKFVMKTDEIEIPEPEKEPEQPEVEKGFFDWCKGVFSSFAGKK